MTQGDETGGRSGDPSLLRRLNVAAALSAFLDAQVLTLRELRAAVGVSRPTAENLLAELLDDGWIEEAAPPSEARGSGRPARHFRFRATSGYVGGLDIGAHKTMAVVTDLRGEALAVRRRELDPDQDAPSRLRDAADNALACWVDAGLRPEDVTAVACGVTGALRAEHGARDVSAGRSGGGLATYSLPGFTEVDVAATLSAGTGRPVTVANDVKLAALAEHWKGAARDHADLVYMFAGHRAGAGVLFGGRVHEGRHGAAGEIGALPALGWEAALARLHARGAALAAGGPPGREGELVIASAAAGDAESTAVLTGFATVLARGAAILALAVDPEAVVLGGGMSRGGDVIVEPFRRELARLTLFPVEVVVSTLGAESVALGAARLALDEVVAALLHVPNS
ncbi:ROK family protein [Saccharothrix deserti]|uniref:ROK family protein n=1 Tax=Saccharothrix deserti TaxID=2593674 RepID=UPI00131D4479|nr:ROK family protein [Saccharothrix deserti]